MSHFCWLLTVRFFPPGDVTALAAQFRWVYEHPEERMAMLGRADKLYEISRWGVTRRAYLDVYSGLIRADDPMGTPDRAAESADDRVGSVR